MQTQKNHLPNITEIDVKLPTLTIVLPDCEYVFQSDNVNALNELSDFCKEHFNAYREGENIDKLIIDGYWSEDDNFSFHEKIFELRLM